MVLRRVAGEAGEEAAQGEEVGGLVELIKGGVEKYGIKNPIFKPSPITPKYDDFLIFEGISVDEGGTQHYLDVHIAYRQACLNAIEYLKKKQEEKRQKDCS